MGVQEEVTRGVSAKNAIAIAKYFNVSVEYLLGLSNRSYDKKFKTGSKALGLSDTAMKRLENIERRNKEELAHRGNVSSDLINFILENDNFWYDIDESLPIYLMTRYEHRTIRRDIDIAKYTLISAFERLIEDIGESFYSIEQNK